MKKFFCLLLAFGIICSMLVACTDTEETDKKEESYTVTFETNGGSAVNAIRMKAGNALTAPSAPTKDGYVFAGWFADEGLLDAFVFGEMPAKDFTLYAKWTADAVDTGDTENKGAAETCQSCYKEAECEPFEFYGALLSVCVDCKQRLEETLAHKYCFTCHKEAECEPYEYEGDVIYVCADCKTFFESVLG